MIEITAEVRAGGSSFFLSAFAQRRIVAAWFLYPFPLDSIPIPTLRLASGFRNQHTLPIYDSSYFSGVPDCKAIRDSSTDSFL